MRILLTGATGGLGRNTALHLRSNGHEVLCTGRDLRALADLAAAGFETKVADLVLDPLDPLCRGREVVVHTAARSSPWGTWERFHDDNILATRRLLEAACTCGVRRFVHTSSPSVLHRDRDQFDLRESTPLPPPANAYARSKALAEEAVLSYADRIEVVGIRPRALYGPWDRTLFPRLVRANDRGGIPLVRGGRFLIDLTSMANAVESLEACLAAPVDALGVFYHVTDGAPLPFRSAVEEVFRALELRVRWRRIPAPLLKALAIGAEAVARMTGGSEPVLTAYGAGVLSHAQTLDIGQARDRLGWVPRHAWTESVEAYARWRRGRE